MFRLFVVGVWAEGGGWEIGEEVGLGVILGDFFGVFIFGWRVLGGDPLEGLLVGGDAGASDEAIGGEGAGDDGGVGVGVIGDE